MFKRSRFNGDISQWTPVSARNMAFMLAHSLFDGDISKWALPRLRTAGSMFLSSVFNQDISNWDMRQVQDISNMFMGAKFRGDLSKWLISDATTAHFIIATEDMPAFKAPSIFHWAALLSNELVLAPDHPWNVYRRDLAPFIDLMGIQDKKAEAQFLQKNWIAKQFPEHVVHDTLALPDLE